MRSSPVYTLRWQNRMRAVQQNSLFTMIIFPAAGVIECLKPIAVDTQTFDAMLALDQIGSHFAR